VNLNNNGTRGTVYRYLVLPFFKNFNNAPPVPLSHFPTSRELLTPFSPKPFNINTPKQMKNGKIDQ
jgi:hypothetical protein